MMHTAKRRACALRLSPIGITSFCKEVANRLFVSQRPVPLWGQGYFIIFCWICQFSYLFDAKGRSVDLDKGAGR